MPALPKRPVPASKAACGCPVAAETTGDMDKSERAPVEAYVLGHTHRPDQAAALFAANLLRSVIISIGCMSNTGTPKVNQHDKLLLIAIVHELTVQLALANHALSCLCQDWLPGQ